MVYAVLLNLLKALLSVGVGCVASGGEPLAGRTRLSRAELGRDER